MSCSVVVACDTDQIPWNLDITGCQSQNYLIFWAMLILTIYLLWLFLEVCITRQAPLPTFIMALIRLDAIAPLRIQGAQQAHVRSLPAMLPRVADDIDKDASSPLLAKGW